LNFNGYFIKLLNINNLKKLRGMMTCWFA